VEAIQELLSGEGSEKEGKIYESRVSGGEKEKGSTLFLLRKEAEKSPPKGDKMERKKIRASV